MELTQSTPTAQQAPTSSATPAAHNGWRAFLARRDRWDWLFGLALLGGVSIVVSRFFAHMDWYEQAIFLGTMVGALLLGWGFKPLRWFMPLVAVLSLIAIANYGGNLQRADQAFLLKYFLSSQSAILWMSALYVLATLAYWTGIAAHRTGFGGFALQMGTGFTWTATLLGFTGLMVRWYESHQIGEGIGHIPVSNLYEVFVLFSLITALFYLYYERKYATRVLGGFVLLVISAAVGFLLWYSFDRGANEIQPLVPALQSWWMKIHVPANFIGYGTFSIAAMVAYAYLLKQHRDDAPGWPIAGLWVAGTAMFLMFVGPMALRSSAGTLTLLAYPVVAAALSGALVAARGPIGRLLPAGEVLDDLMYKAIAVGFAFFTIATILGALWAADAWGTYWQWDPKETWALIVWLNYAAWLHIRLVKGLRGTLAAYWALVGLLITGFAFLGVNMFLSGLHSYGQL